MDNCITTKQLKEVIVSISHIEILKMEYFIHKTTSEESPLTYANPPDIENQHPIYELEIVQIRDRQGQALEPRCFGEFISLQNVSDKTYALYNNSPIYDGVEILTLVSVYALCMAAHLQTGEIILGSPSLQQVRRMLLSEYRFDILKKN